MFPGGRAGSYTIPSGVTNIGGSGFYSCAGLTSVIIPNGVTSIGPAAFGFCTSLTSITIPGGVSLLAPWTFSDCTNLTQVYFKGNAPNVLMNPFAGLSSLTVNYLPGTTGWGASFAGRPTELWLLPYPLILDFGSSFGVKTNRFGFIISWATNLSVVVEGCTNLANAVWSAVGTNTLADGWSYFSDAEWMNYPARCYRLRSP